MINDYEDNYKNILRLDDNLSEIAEKPLSDIDLLFAIDKVIAGYKGDVTELSNAIGVLNEPFYHALFPREPSPY